MGENHGVVINCGNDANVNTTVDQNEVDLSELTLNDLIGTENAADITDIGGIAGTSSGVVRACLNRGTVGYLHIGYNIGGIVGSQTGYVEGCVNYGPVYARKEGVTQEEFEKYVEALVEEKANAYIKRYEEIMTPQRFSEIS